MSAASAKQIVVADPKVAARFWSKVDRRAPDECWPWKGRLRTDGYGAFDLVERKSCSASRVAYKLVTGDPSGLCVCHSCDNPPCVNPAHLFLGTHQDNARDMKAKGRAANQYGPVDKTICSRGHELTPDNTFQRGTRRVCSTCRKERNARNYADRKAAALKHTRGIA